MENLCNGSDINLYCNIVQLVINSVQCESSAVSYMWVFIYLVKQ